MEQRYCGKCRKTMADTNFYTYKDGSKCELCKACLTMHINNFEPDTFLWLLEKFDVPYIESEWNVLRDRAYQKDPYKMTGMSVFGKYLSKMKLKQWKEFNWADSERLQKEQEEKAKLYGAPQDKIKEQFENIKQAYENGEINEAQYLTYAETHAPEPSFNENAVDAPNSGGQNKPYPANSDFEEVEIVDVGADLTEEDKVYLAMKWGRLYRAYEWVALEQLYTEFIRAFGIQEGDISRIDALKMICKTSLKMNQAIDCGDVETYQKLSRVYDSMMKSAKFTEAQNKEGKEDFVDSVGELVAYCEKNGGQIPKYEIDAPLDIVDKIIDDLKEYNRSLIYEDKALAEEIEQYLKNKEIAESMKRDREHAKEAGMDQVELNDDDYIEFQEALESDRQKDEEYINAEGGEDE